MGIEIEHKYLVDPYIIERNIKKRLGRFSESRSKRGDYFITQGYLINSSTTVRVREVACKARSKGYKYSLNKGYMTVKGETIGSTRVEHEMEIDYETARDILNHSCKSVIRKIRYSVEHTDGHLWEVDFFSEDNKGLIIAEIELKSEDEPYELPSWVGEDVTNDSRYYNSNLIITPYTKWVK